MARTQKAFTTVSKDKDIVLINGLGSLSAGSAFGLSGYEVVKKFKAGVVLVDKARPLNNLLDDMIRAKEELKTDLIGVVINNVPEEELEYYQQSVAPYLSKKLKIAVIGVIPMDPTLGAVSVEEALNVFQGELLCGKEKRAELVETYSIGAQNVESALRTFRKIKNKAVITGGDRSDIQLAAMETSTTLLVLTGGHYPNEIIVSRAQTMGVPIVVVRYDTKTAVDRMNGILGHVSLRNASKAKQATNVAQRYIDFPALYKTLGLTMVEKS
jgi:BioD-like phosphotransacetylase family protein